MKYLVKNLNGLIYLRTVDIKKIQELCSFDFVINLSTVAERKILKHLFNFSFFC